MPCYTEIIEFMEEDEIHEIHLISEDELPDKHIRSKDCWCKPVERQANEYHNLDDLDEYHVVWEHKTIH